MGYVIAQWPRSNRPAKIAADSQLLRERNAREMGEMKQRFLHDQTYIRNIWDIVDV